MRENPVFREEILRALRPFRSSILYDQLAREVSPPYFDDRFPTLKCEWQMFDSMIIV